MRSLPLVLLAASCGPAPCADGYGRDDAGNCVALATGDGGTPGDDTGDPTTPDDTGDTQDSGDTQDTEEAPVELDLTEGHPITTLGADDYYDEFYEHITAAVFADGEYGLFGGQGGYVILELATGNTVAVEAADRVFRADLDEETGLVWMSTRNFGIFSADVSDPASPITNSSLPAGTSTWHEDIAAHGGYVLVGAQEEGGVLMADSGELLSTLDVDYAYGVGLWGDRAVVTDADALTLWDISDPSNPIELDRVSMTGSGRDVSFDGARAAVALGGDGVAVFDVDGDALTHRGDVITGGSALGVALDGDDLWVAAWTHVALIWVGEGGPLGLGHQDVNEFTGGIGAGAGRAAVADWFYATSMERAPQTGGAEVVVSERVWFSSSDPTGSASLTFTNAGALDLEIAITDPAEYDVSATSLTLAPNESEAVIITPDPDGQFVDDSLAWATNDPDEATGFSALQIGDQSVGQAHDNFQLQGFTWPDTETQNYQLSDYLGKVVVLVHFASW